MIWSETNFSNSIAVALASNFVTAGYLIYWFEQDAVQTPDGWYGAYSAFQATTYATDAQFQGRLAAAKGLVTVRGKLTAAPTFVTRPNSSGLVPVRDSNQIMVPALAIEVTPQTPLSQFELGTTNKWRARAILVHGFARDGAEQGVFADLLSDWFDEYVTIDILDHDAGTRALLGTVLVERPKTATDIVIDGAESTTWVVECQAQLTFVS